MSQPIVLWNAEGRTKHAFDDAGISIYKTVLAPPMSLAPYTEPTNNLRTVPPLAYFCIRALTPYPEQLHNLQRPISYCKEVVRALVPPKVITRDVIFARKHGADSDDHHNTYDVQSVDPRLWAALAQAMHPLPAEFLDYELSLSDIHLPLLQQVPSRDNFCFVTLLSLPGCDEVCDETIHVLRRLNTLAALDLRGTRIGFYGLTVLSRSLSWSCDELATRTGCWGLRILRLHSCTNIEDDALPILSKFPLLSSIDLRFTHCTPRAISKHLSPAGFKPSSNRTLFHPAPLEVSLRALEHLPPQGPAHGRPHSIYSCPVTSVYRLHVSKPNPREGLHMQRHSLCKPRSSHAEAEELTSLVYSDEDLDEDSNRESDDGSNGDSSWSAPGPVLQNLQDSTTSSIYASRRRHRENRIQMAVVGSAEVQLDPLVLARPPPLWSILDAHEPIVRQQQSHDPQDRLVSIGHTRLTKRHVAGMQDIVTSLTAKNKRRKVESEFVSTSARPDIVSKTRNPFLKSRTSTSKSNGPGSVMRSVFAEQKAAASAAITSRPGKKISDLMPKFCDAGALKSASQNLSLTLAPNSDNATSKLLSDFPSTSNSHLSETLRPVKKIPKHTAKPLKPITSYPVPPCPIEHLLPLPQLSTERKEECQTGLAFPKPGVHQDESDEEGSNNGTPPKRARMDRGVPNTGNKGKRQEKTVTPTSLSTSNPHPPAHTIQKSTAKPLRPITSYPVPPCPIEHLRLVPQLSMKKKKGIQTELPFSTSMGRDDSGEDSESNVRGDEPPKRVRIDRGTTSTAKKGKQKETGFDWNKWRRTTI